MSDTADILAKERAAQTQLTNSRTAALEGITDYDFSKNPPLAMAMLLSKVLRKPDGALISPEEAMVLGLYWYSTGLEPLRKEVYIMSSGAVAFSLQGEIKMAKREGHKLSVPKFKDVERPWPAGLLMQRKNFDKNVKGDMLDFSLDKDIGVECTIKVDGEDSVYTAWFTEWFIPYNPNWWTRKHHMLWVRSQMHALAFGTGISVSQDLVDTPEASSDSDRVVEAKVVAPKQIPLVAGA